MDYSAERFSLMHMRRGVGMTLAPPRRHCSGSRLGEVVSVLGNEILTNASLTPSIKECRKFFSVP